MKKILSLKDATTGISIILSFIILFHILVICRVIPSDIVWGGNINNESNFLRLELISVAVNITILLFVFACSEVIKIRINPTVMKIVFWILFILFLLNTLGNLLAKNTLETLIFTPLTLLLSLFCLRIAIENTLKTNDA